MRLGSETSVPSFSSRAYSGRVVRPLRPIFTIRVSLFQRYTPEVPFLDAICKVLLGSNKL